MRCILLVSFFCLLFFTSCDKEESVAPENKIIPEEFSLQIYGLEEDITYEVKEESSADFDVISMSIDPNSSADRLIIELNVPAHLSQSGHEETVGIVLRSKSKSYPWTFAEDYFLLTTREQSFEEERYAYLDYTIENEEDRIIYESNSISQIPASVKITSVEDGRIQGSIEGKLRLLSGKDRITIKGTFNARLADDLEEE